MKSYPPLDMLPLRGPSVTRSHEEWSTEKVLIASMQLRSRSPLPHISGSQDTLNWLVFRKPLATTGTVVLSMLLAGVCCDAPGGRARGPAANDRTVSIRIMKNLAEAICLILWILSYSRRDDEREDDSGCGSSPSGLPKACLCSARRSEMLCA